MSDQGRSLLTPKQLAASSVVANCSMNRERQLTGSNSYERDLGLDILAFFREFKSTAPPAAGHASSSVAGLSEAGLSLPSPAPITWLDLCCGSARALIEAAKQIASTDRPSPQSQAPSPHVRIESIDLAGHFDPNPYPAVLTLRAASLESAFARPLPFGSGPGPGVSLSNGDDALNTISSAPTPTTEYALITCVHGLHYVGDKLAAIARAVSQLHPAGRFIANLDLANFRFAGGQPAGRTIAEKLRTAGLTYDTRRRLVSCTGPRKPTFNLTYLGANDQAGPNYTGQAAVDSYYEYSESSLEKA